MELKSTLYVLVLIANSALGQAMDRMPNDTVREEATLFPTIQASDYAKKHFVVRGSVILATLNFPTTVVENEIVDMENLECKALLKRDTAALRALWLRDFTLDAFQNDLLLGDNPIPYYVSLNRFVEKLTVLGNTVITSGMESFILLNTNGKVEDRKERRYRHTWIRETFSWRLATKTRH